MIPLCNNFRYSKLHEKRAIKAIKAKGIPSNSLGRTTELAIKIAGIRGSTSALFSLNSTVMVFCGDHGVERQGVSAFPRVGTWANTIAMIEGRAAISVFCEQLGIKLQIVDVAIDYDTSSFKPLKPFICFDQMNVVKGTKDISIENAMSRQEFLKAFEVGREMVIRNISDLQFLALGEMGIGNTTSSASVLSYALNIKPENVTGLGSGIDKKTYDKKIKIVEKSVRRAKLANEQLGGLDTLRILGGAEMAAMAGATFEAAERRIPVVIDGYIAAASVVPLVQQYPNIRDVLILSHRSAEDGFNSIVDFLECRPLLDLNMRLGEGTGASLCLPILKASEALLADLNTYDELIEPTLM